MGMADKINLRALDCVEILTLQDNTIDLTVMDNNDVIQRARPLVGVEMKNSILAEHGFSSLITASEGETSKRMLFDFGFSPNGAAVNAKVLDADFSRVEQMALSHGHLDHVGGLQALVDGTRQSEIPLVLHPAAFRNPRFTKAPNGMKIKFPSFTREKATSAGAVLIETEKPYLMLDDTALFLGGVQRTTSFEKGSPHLLCVIDGKERPDPFDDDTAMVFHIRDKGLVILSGCAHSGIVNTVSYAKKVTGVENVMAIMGGFHLGSADMESVVKPTVAALKGFHPDYIIPTHCTGREAIQLIEKEMPEAFILNMSGTQLTFHA
jgi:7,8-dihydropterin-6-yl-methyl-4-(beta-D-ribofuranosyl)aminobenzene 5'-phosphate synthase